jgi:GNAT superfamily N-acetyltransferase
MTDSSGATPLVTVTDCWSDDLVRKLAALYVDNAAKGPWDDRWTAAADYFVWKWVQNPIRPSLVAYIEEDGRAVAAVTLLFRQFSYQGEPFIAAELADLNVHPDHRGKRLFGLVIEAILAEARSRGIRFIFCIPNKRGGEALLRTGQFTTADDAEHATWLLPLRPLRLAGTHWKALSFLAFADSLWQLVVRLRFRPRLRRAVAASAGEMRFAMDGAYLSYRVSCNPAARYACYPSPSPPEGAAAISRSVGYTGLPVSIVGRIASHRPDVYLNVIAGIVNDALAGNAAFVALWAPRRLGRLLRPLFFLPVQTKRIYIAKQSDPAILAHLASLHVEMLDSDKI